ncbi:MAG TPA: serine/threonine-protein kinase [Solirubrobacteraceae bacterium]|nr:serine/threonine-protein kinase [Solirubrobacteraceae bacterium]
MSLDGYDVIRELGRGGMAIVHLARQRDLGRLVALKELAGFNAGDDAFAERFLRESRVAGSLNHQNIVTVYEYFEDGGTPFIAMELIEGGSLRPLIGEMTLPKVGRVLEDLLAAVGYAARAGIVHRDLKPENALVTKDGRVKVADFGIAKAAAGGQQGLTSEGMTVGTPEYMSPEQAMARDVSTASDLYAVGCMTYEMLTGRLPFSEGSQVALLMHHVNDPVPDVREVDPLIPESVALWVAKMTEKDPDDRPRDAGAAWEAFEEAMLEFTGPLWRRDATLEPASEIDLDDLPPQGPAPRRPATRCGAHSSAALPEFQTYHAPAALHEQLAAEGGDGGAAVVTPPAVPVRRAVTPAPQTAAAPARPAVVTAPPATAPAEEPPADEQGRRVPVPAIAAGAVLAGIVAFVIGISSGGSAEVASAGGDGFELKAPSGWAAAAGPGIAGLTGDGLAAVAPSGAATGEGIAAVRATPAAAAKLVPAGATAQRVQLDAGEAVAYGNSTYLLPTSDGTLVVSCSAAPAVRSACGSVAASLDLTRGSPSPLGPTADGERAVTGALSRLRDGVRHPAEDLRGARSRGAQAFAATDLSRAYRAAASDLAPAPVGALAEPARDRLAGALGRLATAWRSYARAVRSGNASGARRAVSRARASVNAARGALGRAGYPGTAS